MWDDQWLIGLNGKCENWGGEYKLKVEYVVNLINVEDKSRIIDMVEHIFSLEDRNRIFAY